MFKEKIETEEQKILRKQKEAKEIAKWEKEKAKPKLAGYIFYFLLIITVVYIVDEVTTQIGTQMQDAIVAYFQSRLSIPASKITSAFSLLGTLAIIPQALAYFYKPLSDRFGRKIFLIINTLGMGLGMLLIGITTNLPVYIIGSLVIAFFTPHDMQVIYIQECSPKDKRGTYYTVIKAFATLGMLIIPLVRDLCIPEGGYENWQMVYLIPAALALVISILGILFMRETDPFMDNRLKYLRMSDIERENAKKEANAVAEKEGVISGLKYMFTHKQILWLGLAACLIWMGYGITVNYAAIYKMGFLGLNAEELKVAIDTVVGKTITDEDITQFDVMCQSLSKYITYVLYAFPVGSAFAQSFPGFIADKWGRKQATIFCCVLSLITFILFWFGCYNQLFGDYKESIWTCLIIGFMCGCTVGAFWMAGDLIQFLCTESVPTSVRVSVTNVFGLLSVPGLAVGMLVPSFIGSITTDLNLPIVTLIVSIVGMTVGSIILMIKAKDTKGVDLETVTGNE